MKKEKLIRITTVPISLKILLKGQLAYMNKYFEVIGVAAGPHQELNEVSIQENIRVQQIEMTRKITPFQDLVSIFKLYKFLKNEKPFIVHTHTPKAGLVGMIAARLARVPHRYHTVAGLPLLESKGVKRVILNYVEKLTYYLAHKVYPNSFELLEIIKKEKFCNSKKLKVIGNGSSNGVDTAFFKVENFNAQELQQLKNSLKISQSDFVFVFVGRLVGDKGINELVRAFSKLSEKFNSCKLLLVGALEQHLDPLQTDVIKIIQENKSILSVGFQNDVRPYFAISNALIFPSYREGFPNVVLQAGAMELPCIVTNINGCNEIIIQNKNGLIIPVKSEIAIFEAMTELYTNEQFYASLKSNARQIIVEKFEQKFMWEAIFDEYKNN